MNARMKGPRTSIPNPSRRARAHEGGFQAADPRHSDPNASVSLPTPQNHVYGLVEGEDNDIDIDIEKDVECKEDEDPEVSNNHRGAHTGVALYDPGPLAWAVNESDPDERHPNNHLRKGLGGSSVKRKEGKAGWKEYKSSKRALGIL
ncbi:hypothetical protein M422DRAFT_26234, partial [Sphaerobolus stellatus SS14]